MPPDAPEAAAPDAPAAPEGIETPSAVVGTEPAEPAAPAAPEQTPKEIELSERFNQVTAREKELRESNDRIKTERETFESRGRELEEAQRFRQTFKDDPLAGLKALGVEFKDIAERVLNDDVPTADHKIAKLEKQWADKLQAETEAATKAEEEAKEANEKSASAERQAAIDEAHGNIKQVIDESPEKFELIKTQGAEQLVFDIAGDVYRETGKLLPWSEAAEKVEKQLEEEMEKVYGTERFKGRYQKRPDREERSQDEKEHDEANFYAKKLLQEKYSGMLSNQMTSETGTPPETERWRTDEESKDFLAEKLKKMLEA